MWRWVPGQSVGCWHQAGLAVSPEAMVRNFQSLTLDITSYVICTGQRNRVDVVSLMF